MISKNSNCIVDYKLPEVSPGTLLNQQTAILAKEQEIMKYNNVIFLGLCLGLTTYSALSADSVIKISGHIYSIMAAQSHRIHLNLR